MGSNYPDAGARVTRRPGVVLVGLIGGLMIVVAAIAAAPSAQEAETASSSTEARAGDPAPYRGWGAADFPHDFHIDDLELPCEDCHHETNAARLHMPHDQYFNDFWIECTICHQSEGEAALDPQWCGECHPDEPRGAADETLSFKVAVHTNCWECHESGTGVEASENCLFCHSGAE